MFSMVVHVWQIIYYAWQREQWLPCERNNQSATEQYLYGLLIAYKCVITDIRMPPSSTSFYRQSYKKGVRDL